MLKKLHDRYDQIQNMHIKCLAMLLILSPGFFLMGVSEVHNIPPLYHIGFMYICLMGVYRIIYVEWLKKGEADA